MAESDPLCGEKTTRAQLALSVRERFREGYDPLLVYLDSEWHYPLDEDWTVCDRKIPDVFHAVRASDFRGPSTRGCSECWPMDTGTNRGLRRQIVNHLDVDGRPRQSFNKDALLAILEVLEEHEREQLPGGDR